MTSIAPCQSLKRESTAPGMTIKVPKILKYSASVVQGSAIGPASFVIAGSNLKPLADGNEIDKYADDIYLVIPEDNNNSCADEVEMWKTGKRE